MTEDPIRCGTPRPVVPRRSSGGFATAAALWTIFVGLFGIAWVCFLAWAIYSVVTWLTSK